MLSKRNNNPNSSVVAETTKLLPNKSYDGRILYRSRHSVTKQLKGETVHAALNNKLFKRLAHIKEKL